MYATDTGNKTIKHGLYRVVHYENSKLILDIFYQGDVYMNLIQLLNLQLGCGNDCKVIDSHMMFVTLGAS